MIDLKAPHMWFTKDVKLQIVYYMNSVCNFWKSRSHCKWQKIGITVECKLSKLPLFLSMQNWKHYLDLCIIGGSNNRIRAWKIGRNQGQNRIPVYLTPFHSGTFYQVTGFLEKFLCLQSVTVWFNFLKPSWK